MAKQSDDNRIITNQDGPSAVNPAIPNSLELAQIYALIDSILPFEACLYYQVAPLFIDGSCLVMGTVDPDDPAAAEYVTKQLSYINYSIRFQKIASDWHRDLLSQYLKHTSQESSQGSVTADEQPDAANVTASQAVSSEAANSSAWSADSAEIMGDPAAAAGAAVIDEQMQATLILEQIEEMTATMPRDFTSHLVEAEQADALEEEAGLSAIALEAPPVDTPTPTPVASEPILAPPAEHHESVAPTAEASPSKPSVPLPPVPPPAPPSPSEPVLEVSEVSPTVAATPPPPAPPPVPSPPPAAMVADEPAADDSHDDDISRLLCALPPKVLMQALLDKVIGDGIGRLYLKHQAPSNRILWSRNGVLEGLIEPVDSQVLQAVINEFKKLTHVAVTPVTQPKQVEIERTQNGQRILLRLKIIPGVETEQATLQVLRGAALQFHQQQQMDRLGRHALDAAQILQQRLNAMRDRARKSLDSPPGRSRTLSALVKLLKELDIQVQEIEAAYHAHEEE